MNTKIRYQLILNVEFDPHGTAPAELERHLDQVVTDSVNNGTLTGETPATVEHYSYSVKRKFNRYPKKALVAHYRKRNTKVNNRLRNWLDSGSYEILG